jgi:hypothetical protein
MSKMKNLNGQLLSLVGSKGAMRRDLNPKWD